MNGKKAKALRRLATAMAEYKVDAEQLKDEEFMKIATKKAYKLLKKNYNK